MEKEEVENPNNFGMEEKEENENEKDEEYNNDDIENNDYEDGNNINYNINNLQDYEKEGLEDNQNLSLDQGDRALNLRHTIGFTTNKIGLIHNLTIDGKKEIFLPAAHTGVIYNYETGKQKLLQGHCNEITACCSIYDPEEKKRWLVTADSGENSMIVIWDPDTGENYKNIFKIPTDEIVSMDICPKSLFIATLANKKKEYINEKGELVKEVISQKITLWEWKKNPEQIFISDFFDHDGEIFNLLRFNPNVTDEEIELIIQGPSKILFWNINPMKPEACRPYFPIKSKGDKRVAKDKKEDKKDDKDPKKEKEKKEEKEKKNKFSKNKDVEYTQSTFLNGHSMAITATTAGYVIVWDICEALCKEDEIKTDRRKIKTVQLSKYKRDIISEKDIIKCLLNYEKKIVIGCGDGAIKFFEYNFIIVRWFENVSWLVTGISFDMTACEDPNKKDFKEEEDNFDMDMDENSNKFKCLPFITTDISGSIKRIYDTEASYIEYNDEHILYNEVYRGIESNIVSIAIHPKYSLIAVAADGINNEFKKEKNKKKDGVIREKKFEFRPYVQIFPFPDHMKFIRDENKMKEEEKIRKKNENNFTNKPKNVKEEQYNYNDVKTESQYKLYLEVIPTVLEFSNDGEFLVVGTSDAHLMFLDPNNLSKIASPVRLFNFILIQSLEIKDITDKEDKNEKTLDIVFSPDGVHFAATDTFSRIGLFRYGNPWSQNENEQKEWVLVGRFQFKADAGIVSFTFNDNGNKLYCATKDKYLHEFDLIQNSKYDLYKLPVPKSVKLENDGNINCLVLSPLHFGKDHLIVANSEYKLRLVGTLATQNAEHNFVVKQTSLGPTYGNPIEKLRVVPGQIKTKDYQLFQLITKYLDYSIYLLMEILIE